MGNFTGCKIIRYSHLPVYAKYCISENRSLMMTKYKEENVMSLFNRKEITLLIG